MNNILETISEWVITILILYVSLIFLKVQFLLFSTNLIISSSVKVLFLSIGLKKKLISVCVLFVSLHISSNIPLWVFLSNSAFSFLDNLSYPSNNFSSSSNFLNT